MSLKATRHRVLVVGGGAREHALIWKCVQSPLAEQVYVAPGNGGTGGLAHNVAIQADDVPRLARFCKEEAITLAVLGPEAAVEAGVGDALREMGILVFGPNRGAGRIETSKAFAKELMVKAGIPTAAHAVFEEAEGARRWARERGGRVAVKADGLALGKGVIVCHSLEEAERALEEMLVKRSFGRSGAKVVVEELLEGPELSVFGITDGQRVLAMAPARDFKRALEGDEGPNTGGMGAYSPPAGVTEEQLAEAAERVLEPAVRALRELGEEYRGVLYAGLMLTADGLRCIEFNARFGDPEAEVVLPRLEDDLLPILAAAADGDVSGLPPLRWSPRPAVAVVLASGGYPASYRTGLPISGLTDLPPGVMVFHGATRFTREEGLVTCGGRVLTVVGRGESVGEARRAALEGVRRLGFAGSFHRADIAMEAE